MIREDFPILNSSLYFNTAYVGLMSKSLFDYRNKMEYSFSSIGYDFKNEKVVDNCFSLGFKRKGNLKTLKFFENKFGYKSIITKPYKKNKKIISSTIIRKKIASGKINEANKLLGRKWSIEGKVIAGEKRGRKIGFPTCNLKLNNYVVPRSGVYAVNVTGNNFTKKGIANIGFRPTFNGQSLLLETNIFGINKNLYNKVINVHFKKFIRKEKKFNNIQELKKQIKIDIQKAKN